MDIDVVALSVVVPTRDRPHFLDACLASITASLGPKIELIVVDSASKSPRIAEIAAAHGATYIRCELSGVSRARNAGWKAAQHHVVAFIDDDIRVGTDWASAITRAFVAFPEAAFVAGRIGIPEGEDPEEPIALLVHPEAFWIERDTSGDVAHGANVAVRRSALDAIGGFDEQMGSGARYRAAEDKDLLDRLFIEGFRGRYEPTAAVVHIPWRKRSELIRLYWGYGIGNGARLAKLIKTEHSMVRAAFYETFWRWGVRSIRDYVLRRDGFRTWASFVRTCAMCLGLVRALPRRVQHGHYLSPRGP
jgi:glycosyltransferase involved in cell wall biosynthesis